jgi:hypothetical protein
MGNASALAGFLLMLGAVSASPASAQTTSVDGAYAQLSPGNAKIARALFDAQVTTKPTTGGTTTTTTTAPAPKALTLDQIAAMKQSGQGWGQIFKTLKAQGLVQDKSLGQVVSRYQHQQQTSTSSGAATTASNRIDRGSSVTNGGDNGGSVNGGSQGKGK